MITNSWFQHFESSQTNKKIFNKKSLDIANNHIDILIGIWLAIILTLDTFEKFIVRDRVIMILVLFFVYFLLYTIIRISLISPNKFSVIALGLNVMGMSVIIYIYHTTSFKFHSKEQYVVNIAFLSIGIILPFLLYANKYLMKKITSF